jgi:hypothetical protein
VKAHLDGSIFFASDLRRGEAQSSEKARAFSWNDRCNCRADYAGEIGVAKQNHDWNFGPDKSGAIMTFVLYNALWGIAHFGFAECDTGLGGDSAAEVVGRKMVG